MKISNLNKMTRGWFIGDFEPSLNQTEVCEVAVKEYKEKDYEDSHYHKIATEYTVVVKGRIRMFDQEFEEGDIIITEPGDVTDFLALTEAKLVVVKIPGATHDKYLKEND